jgi:hypothetical protein
MIHTADTMCVVRVFLFLSLYCDLYSVAVSCLLSGCPVFSSLSNPLLSPLCTCRMSHHNTLRSALSPSYGSPSPISKHRDEGEAEIALGGQTTGY